MVFEKSSGSIEASGHRTFPVAIAKSLITRKPYCSEGPLVSDVGWQPVGVACRKKILFGTHISSTDEILEDKKNPTILQRFSLEIELLFAYVSQPCIVSVSGSM